MIFLNIWQDFFGVSNDTVFTVFTTLSIFFLGLIIKWCYSKYKKTKKNKNIKKFIIAQLEVLSKTSILQRDKFIEYKNKLREERIQNIELVKVANLNTRYIRDIKFDQIFEVLVLSYKNKKRNNLENFNKLVKQLDLLDGIINLSYDAFINTHNLLSSYENKWNKNIEEIGDFHDKLLNDMTYKNIDPRTDPFLKEFYSIYHDWTKMDHRLDMYIAIDSIINPILEKARATQPNTFATYILRNLLSCIDAFSNHKNLREIIIKEFDNFSTQLETIAKDFSEIKNNI
ncbi:MAG: hypothetical protein JXA68_03920 [Ignavibacteriales bacterium]|nr:hypothetical protein [Ignavibacteriales bacterium]